MAVFTDRASADERYTDARAALCDVLFEVNSQDVPVLERLQRGRLHMMPSWNQVGARFQLLVADLLAAR